MTDSKQLTVRAQRLLDLLCDPTDRRSMRARIQDSGFSEGYAYRLAKSPAFAAELSARSRLFLTQHLGQVYAHLRYDSIDETLPPSDRHRAARLLLQAAGELKPETTQVTVNDNRSVVFGSLPDRLAKHLEERRQMLRDVMSISSESGPGPDGREIRNAGAVHGGNGFGAAMLEDAEDSETPGDSVEVGNE